MLFTFRSRLAVCVGKVRAALLTGNSPLVQSQKSSDNSAFAMVGDIKHAESVNPKPVRQIQHGLAHQGTRPSVRNLASSNVISLSPRVSALHCCTAKPGLVKSRWQLA
jgi:hypothetical protein